MCWSYDSWPDSTDDHEDDPVDREDGDDPTDTAGTDHEHAHHVETSIWLPTVTARTTHLCGWLGQRDDRAVTSQAQ